MYRRNWGYDAPRAYIDGIDGATNGAGASVGFSPKVPFPG